MFQSFNQFIKESTDTNLPIDTTEPIVTDHEVAMAQASLDAIIIAATELKAKIGDVEIDIPAWIQDHITNAENNLKQANQGYK